jgi:geranylgeranyl pyrophosphate synthase
MSETTYIVSPAPDARPQTGQPRSPVWFLDFVRPDLEAVEARMNDDLGSDVRTVYALTRHILNAGGKRLRPAMLALSARAICPTLDTDRIATVGAAVEFVHMATLVHDDVVDNTATRRGKPTANAVFGNGVAVLSGDYILARAMRLLALDGDLTIIRTVAEITVDMSEGEVMEISATGKPDLAMSDYLEILRKKTAVFVEGCCRCGAILAGAEPRLEEALADYGYRLGMAFQLADDLLDYTGDPCVTGKPRGSDLRDGRATLPFLLGLAAAAPREKKRLLAAFGNSRLDEGDMLDVCDILEMHGAFEQTRESARDHVAKADIALSQLPPSTARECFSALTCYVVQRDR